MIAPDGEHEADGLVLRGLTRSDIRRLDFYEGSFDYDLHQTALTDGTKVQVYVPQAGRWTPDGPWSLADWVSDLGDMSMIAAGEVMSYYGTRSRDEVAEMFPVIRARASAAVRAQQSVHGTSTFQGQVDVLSRDRRYSDFFALDEFTLRHDKFDGSTSDQMHRALFVAADAALVLPYDPVRDRVMLVEQVRFGPLARGDHTLWQLEPIAGRVDPGETPQEAARREALEEAGLELDALETIAESYPSPGTSSEFYYIYLALTDLPDRSAGLGGLAEEHEDIRSHLIPFDELMERAKALDFGNAALVAAVYYLAYHRDRLRS